MYSKLSFINITCVSFLSKTNLNLKILEIIAYAFIIHHNISRFLAISLLISLLFISERDGSRADSERSPNSEYAVSTVAHDPSKGERRVEDFAG